MREPAKPERMRAVIIEDSVPLGTLYQQMLSNLDVDAEWFETGGEALEFLETSAPDLLLVDLELPDMHGHDILKQLASAGVSYPRVVITAHGSVDGAVDAMRLGASDFLEKPFTAERLQITVDNVLDRARLSREVAVIRDQIERDGYAGFVGRSLPMQVVYRIIDSAAASRASVFITGESGTGKELCAQAIHERSDRADGPFVPINCGAIPRELFESEIFGHVKGAFSGATANRQGAAERANGGTLFLDEIGEMDLDLQVKLLRLIQTGTFQPVGSNRDVKVDVRFVCATNRDPQSLIAEGSFREDLYYRLNVIPITMPALRERERDVLQIARHFLGSLSVQENRRFQQFDAAVESLLLGYDWPGNVRQLHNVIHNIVLLNDGEIVTREMMPSPLDGPQVQPASRPSGGAAAIASAPRAPQPAADAGIRPLAEVEREAIESAIASCGGNIPLAASHLGVSASTIYRKIKVWQDSLG